VPKPSTQCHPLHKNRHHSRYRTFYTTIDGSLQRPEHVLQFTFNGFCLNPNTAKDRGRNVTRMRTEGHPLHKNRRQSRYRTFYTTIDSSLQRPKRVLQFTSKGFRLNPTTAKDRGRNVTSMCTEGHPLHQNRRHSRYRTFYTTIDGSLQRPEHVLQFTSNGFCLNPNTAKDRGRNVTRMRTEGHPLHKNQ
jgi:hypothetical protein